MKPELIDTHCHLDFPDFDSDREDVIKRAEECGVKKMINIGCDLGRAKKSIELAKKYDFIFASAGLHPQEAEQGNEKFYSELEKLLKDPNVVAIGECGLEFFSEYDNPGSREKQKEVFLRQLDLANRFKKPIIIHCRRAYPEILEILRKEKEKNPELSGVAHFFVGRLAQAEEFLKLDFLLSFTGIITYAHDYDKIIKNVPLEKIIVETDAPFVAPVPYRGKRCEPVYVKYIAEKIAEIKNLEFAEVADITTENARKLFNF